MRLSIGLLGALALSSSLSTAALAASIFTSNDKLDQHVIYQDFAFFQPYDSTAYQKLVQAVPTLKQYGITDVWFAPPFRALDANFEEGYAVSDRYDLGEFPAGHAGATATKYGTAAELRAAIAALHAQKINAICDLVPNQMFLGGQEVTAVTATDIYGNPNDPNVVGLLYPGYTKSTGAGQGTYGLLKQWDHTLENGFSTQSLGLSRLMVDPSGNYYRYYGPNDSRNNLPSWLAAAAAANQLNTIDTYLSVDGYFAVENVGNPYIAVYRPYLLYYVDPRPGVMQQAPLDFIRAQGVTGTDDQVRQFVINQTNDVVATYTNTYLSQQYGYSAASEAGIAALRIDKANNGDVDKSVLQYEFLIGTDIDNTNPDVQAETLNWQEFLLDKYDFDGFRFDAAGHYNTAILNQSAKLMSGRFQKDIDNHLSVIESYVDAQANFEASNNYGQLAYDADLYNAIQATMEAPIASGPLSNVITGSIAYAGRVGTGYAIPNWSFINNHDQEHNVIATIPVPADVANGAAAGSAAWQLDEMQIYDADRKNAVKRYAPYNVPSAYALMLTNKGTVPTVFYGDIFESDKAYNSTPTIYYGTIAILLQVRQRYVSGAQLFKSYVTNTSSTAGQDLISSVRLGNKRTEGIAVVIGDDPATSVNIKVAMGSSHRAQWFVNATSSQHETLFTNDKGELTVPVRGSITPLVHGYLGVFVPVSL